jgi:hypothetical protein
MSATNVEIKRLSRADIERRLLEFERAHRLATGEELSSAEFFERFEQGECDSMFGMRWAGYVRALERATD